MATDDESAHRRVLDAVAGTIPNLPLELTPPEIAQQVYRIVYDITGNADPYRETKGQSNQLALPLYPRL